MARYRAWSPVVESLTVVYDAGQNSADNHTVVEDAGHRVRRVAAAFGSPRAARDPGARIPRRSTKTAIPDVTFLDTDVTALGVTRRAVLTHSPTLHAKQSRGLDQTLAKARSRLAELQARLARGRTRRQRAAVQADIATISNPAGSPTSSPSP